MSIVGDGRQVLAAQCHVKIMRQFDKLFSGPRETELAIGEPVVMRMRS